MDTLFNQPLKVVNVRLHSFADSIQHAGGGAIALNWQPPAQDDIDAGLGLTSLLRHPLVENTNQTAMTRYPEAQPMLVDIMLVKEAIPAMAEQKRILHSSPPIIQGEMCGPIKGVIIGTMLYEDQAINQQDAENQISAGEIDLTPCHHYHAVGPVADIVSPSMPLWVIENKTSGHRTLNNFDKGPGKVLRFGANNDEVLNRLAQMRDESAPVMKTTIAQHGELELKPLMAQALHMEDEVYNRNTAVTGLLIKRLLPVLLTCSLPQEYIQRVVTFITDDGHFFPNLSMAIYKAMMDAVANIPFSPMVAMMARNRMSFGIRLSDTSDHWSQAPANTAESLFFPGFGVSNAATDLGDSAVTETTGMGGFTITSSPAIVKFVGDTPADATNSSRRIQTITLGSNPAFTLPALDFAPTAAGIDAHKVTDHGILSVVNTGIAHEQAGVRQIDAGITAAPIACLVAAVRVLAKIVTKENHHG